MNCIAHSLRPANLRALWLHARRAVRHWSRRALSVGGVAVSLGLICSAGTAPAAAATLEELRADPKLTPERFIQQFADFKFSLGRSVRKPEAFLSARAGDCDDFATLAADVLRQKGYTPRLVAVFMPHAVHVVCYVAETKSYLDFNRRAQAAPLVSSNGELANIAASVAKSFRADWRSVSEFTFRNGTRSFVKSEFH
ncbi:hypothetical protein LBMAG56_23020 [Verrucomicrobiota bacterium]|nr:hypothetical protein LBMAG56_23020 [Verrucomicrobiota bacterium]